MNTEKSIQAEWRSNEINEISKALSQAQGEIDAAPKDRKNPFFKSRYATLASCRMAAQPSLTKYGLAIVQSIKTDITNNMVGVLTLLTHSSGQWFSSETWCKPKTLGPQDVGLASTYLRRYGFSAIVGLVSEDDDDGNSQSQTATEGEPKAERSGTINSAGTKAQQDQFDAMKETAVRQLMALSPAEVLDIFQGRSSEKIIEYMTDLEKVKTVMFRISAQSK